MIFNTPIDKDKWINSWLSENKIAIEMYNFDNEGETKVKTIQKAMSSLRPIRDGGSIGKDKTITIPIIGKTFYSKTVSIDAEEEIAEAILNYENKQQFIGLLKEQKIIFSENNKGKIIIEKENQKDIAIEPANIVPEGTVFENEGDILFINPVDRKKVKDVSFSAYDLPYVLGNNILFKNEGTVYSNRGQEDKYLTDFGSGTSFENTGDVIIEGKKKFTSILLFKNEGDVVLSDIEQLGKLTLIKNEGDFVLGNNIDCHASQIIENRGQIIIEEEITSTINNEETIDCQQSGNSLNP